MHIVQVWLEKQDRCHGISDIRALVRTALRSKVATPEDGPSKQTELKCHTLSVWAQGPPVSLSHHQMGSALAHPMSTRFPSISTPCAVLITLAICTLSMWNSWRVCVMQRAVESSGKDVRKGTSSVSGAFMKRMGCRCWHGMWRRCIAVISNSVPVYRAYLSIVN